MTTGAWIEFHVLLNIFVLNANQCCDLLLPEGFVVFIIPLFIYPTFRSDLEINQIEVGAHFGID